MENSNEEVPCKTHPYAPHGFNRDASHSFGRYVCDCEFWEPEDAMTTHESLVEDAKVRAQVALAGAHLATAMAKSATGLRFNSDKLPYHLVSPHAMQELVKVLAVGAKKYAPRNWEKGMLWEEQTVSSLLRHVEAWRRGEENDPETGLSHMAHVMCNAMFLMHFIATGTGKDDRMKYVKEDTGCYTLEKSTPYTLTTTISPLPGLRSDT